MAKKADRRILYLDCFSGASGDMILGALLDVGVSRKDIERELGKIAIEPFTFDVRRTTRGGITATRVIIHPEEKTVVRYWRNIRQILEHSDLAPAVKEASIAAFERLAGAEAKIHGKPIEQVHFHEVGSIDTIVDIVGCMAGFQALKLDQVVVSPVATGIGMVRVEHGMLPIPAPATLEILEDAPLYSGNVPHELTTPTGAAILRTVASSFGDLPPLAVEAVGYGAGDTELEQPNVLRAVLGRAAEQRVASELPAIGGETLYLVETNIDDMNPELYPHLVDRLFEIGAADAWYTPIVMKKGRPATCLSVLVRPELLDEAIELLLRESSTLGVRYRPVERKMAKRTTETVKVRGEKIRVKVAWLDGTPVNFAAEFEDCRKAAARLGVPAKDLLAEAAAEARTLIADRSAKSRARG